MDVSHVKTKPRDIIAKETQLQRTLLHSCLPTSCQLTVISEYFTEFLFTKRIFSLSPLHIATFGGGWMDGWILTIISSYRHEVLLSTS